MSLTLGIYKGRTYQDSEFIDDRPVSFFRVWKKVWSPVIAACGGRLFQDCSYSWRVRDELKPVLIQFYQEHKNEDYWFDIG